MMSMMVGGIGGMGTALLITWLGHWPGHSDYSGYLWGAGMVLAGFFLAGVYERLRS